MLCRASGGARRNASGVSGGGVGAASAGEAARSYEANMTMFETGRTMRSQMLDLLK